MRCGKVELHGTHFLDFPIPVELRPVVRRDRPQSLLSPRLSPIIVSLSLCPVRLRRSTAAGRPPIFRLPSRRIRAAVRKALVDVYAATLSREILTKQQAAQAQNVELLEQRLQAGDISAPQVSLARVTASQAALLLRDAEKPGAEARARLATAIGVPASALAGVEFSFRGLDRLPAPDVRALRCGALLHRSDVLAALAEYAAADAALRQEVAKQYPDLHLNPGYAFDQGQDKFTLGLSLTLPVLDQNRGPIAEAVGKRREAAASSPARAR